MHKPKSGHAPAKGSVTIKTVATALDLSVSTVSRALRGESTVTPETMERIRQKAAELGYRRDLRGVNLRTGRTNTICAVLTAKPRDEYGDPAAMMLIEGMIAGISGTDRTVVIRPVHSMEEQLYVLQELAGSNRFDGFILDHTLPQDPRAKYLLEADVPFVTFGRTELFTPHAFFDVDDAAAAEMVTTELLRRGFGRIAFIEPPSHYFFARQRRIGYQRALEAAGVPFDRRLVIEAGMETRIVEVALEQLLNSGLVPDAFIGPNEMGTIAAIRYCRSAGLDVDKIGFASRDSTRFFDYLQPAVISAYFPAFLAGEAVARLMLRRLDGEPAETLQSVVRPKLILR